MHKKSIQEDTAVKTASTNQSHLKQFYQQRKSSRTRRKSLSDAHQATRETSDHDFIPRIRLVQSRKTLPSQEIASSSSPSLDETLESLRQSNNCLAQNYQQFQHFTYRILGRIMTRADPLDTTEPSINDILKARPSSSLVSAICAISAVLSLLSHIEEASTEAYPNLLAAASTTAFDVSLSIELVIKHEPLLSQQIIERLKDWERQLLAFDVWQQEEPLYRLLSLEQKDTSEHSSPLKAIFAMQSLENQTGQEPDVISRLEFFFRKFLRMAAGRIDRVCVDLGLSDFARVACWSLFVRTVEMEAQVRLFFQRHYIQVLIATVYSVAKFYDENRPFTRIISVLQAQLGPQGFQDNLFRSVFMGPDQPREDLVKFYNDVYLPRMRDRIYKLPPRDLHSTAIPSVYDDAVTPRTPDGKRKRRSTISYNDHILPMPTSISPHSPSMLRQLSDRVTLEMSPCKARLSRSVAPTKATPLKMSLNSSIAHSNDIATDLLVITDNRIQKSDLPRPSTPIARRLDF